MTYITIEREYGSGGRAVAQQLSAETGLPCYGREVLEAASQYLHMPVAQLEQYEENPTGSILYSIAMLGKVQSADPDLLMKDGSLLVAEHRAIREFADRGPAIFLGHCASEALKDRDKVVTVFIKSTPEARKKRIVREYGIPENQVSAAIRRFDRKRAGYYQTNTTKKWRDFQNYDLVLDSAALGTEGCVAALKGLLSRWEEIP